MSVATRFDEIDSVSTRDTLDHLFCAECFTPRDDVIVALCGRLRDGDPIGMPAIHPCVVCYRTRRCQTCGAEFE